jgi:hypothetical protein
MSSLLFVKEFPGKPPPHHSEAIVIPKGIFHSPIETWGSYGEHDCFDTGHALFVHLRPLIPNPCQVYSRSPTTSARTEIAHGQGSALGRLGSHSPHNVGVVTTTHTHYNTANTPPHESQRTHTRHYMEGPIASMWMLHSSHAHQNVSSSAGWLHFRGSMPACPTTTTHRRH